MLSVQQIDELLQIFEKYNLVFIAKHLGPDYLTDKEVSNLLSVGINPNHYYDLTNDTVNTSFYFGLISDIVEQSVAKNLTFEELKTGLRSGSFIPLTQFQKQTIGSIKKQFLGDIKANKNRIFNDINNIISSNDKDNRQAYEKVIRDEIERGVLEKKTSAQIASELGHKTGDWNRNFQRIVEYISHTAFDEGRAAVFEHKGGNDVLVYKDVYEGACRYCIKAYLTGGIGSQPIIFKLSQLKANGTNIGRKVDELKPVIGSHHPHCRCMLMMYNEKYIWNPKEGDFTSTNPDYKPKVKINRKPIRVTVRDKEYVV